MRNAQESGHSRSMRLFLALQPGDENRRALARAARKAAELPSLQAVPAGNLHLTLRFFGDVSEELRPALTERCRQLAAHSAPFSWKPGNLCYFPSRERPRIIAVGLQDPPGPLLKLFQNCEKAVRHLGLPGESRPFRPHFTLARVKGALDPERLVPLEEHYRRGPATALVRETLYALELVRSTLTPAGPVYETLEHLELGGNE